MKKALLLSLVFVLALAGNSMAITWQYNSAFNQTIFDYNNNWSPISYPDMPPSTPSPGGADGEACDIEGSKFAYDNDYLYFAVTSSFGYGATINSTFYSTGEFFFGFNGANATYAANTDGYLYELTGAPLGIPDLPQSYYNNPSIVAAVGAFAHDDAYSTEMGYIDTYMHSGLSEIVTGDTYVWEMRISKSMFAGVDFANVSSVSWHMTLACGNDLLEDGYDMGVVPEPATLLLLGLGLMGGGIIRRKIR